MKTVMGLAPALQRTDRSHSQADVRRGANRPMKINYFLLLKETQDSPLLMGRARLSSQLSVWWGLCGIQMTDVNPVVVGSEATTTTRPSQATAERGR